MLNRLMDSFTRALKLMLCIAVALTPTSNLLAQTNDTEAPVLIHRQLESGVAGELQTFLARVSDDFGVARVTLYYRQSDKGAYQSIAMRPLLDSIGEYMIAIETSGSDYGGLQYYLQATDTSGNSTNRGFDYAPIVLPLSQPLAPIATITPEPLPSSTQRRTPAPTRAPATTDSDPAGSQFNTTTILLGLGALVVLGALASSGGSGGGGEPDPGTPGTPNTVRLTITTEQPNVN